MKAIFFACLLMYPAIAAGWELDGFRSGMNDDEVTSVMTKRGQPSLMRTPISNIPGAYTLHPPGQDNTLWFTFCKGRMYEYSKERDGRVSVFARLVDAETKKRGHDPETSITYFPTASLILATWRAGDYQFEYLLAEDYKHTLGIAEHHIDVAVKSSCS